MSAAKNEPTLLATCCFCLAMATSALADFVGVTTVIKDDPDTEFLCTQGNGILVPGPLTVCNVYAVFDDPADRLISVFNADLQVYNGANPDVFYQHPFGNGAKSPLCIFLPLVPDLVCDSFFTIGVKCSDAFDSTSPDLNLIYNLDLFEHSGHILGGWFNSDPPNGQGDAGTWPNLQVLILQSSVAQGLSMSGMIEKIFWEDPDTGDVIAEEDIPVECAAKCPPGPCNDGDSCTGDPNAPDPENADTCMDGVCTGPPIVCPVDGNVCTDDVCDPVIGCTHVNNTALCVDGNPCTSNDTCGGGSCQPGTPDCAGDDDCFDNNPCTTDSCDVPNSCCSNPPVTCPDDNDPCTVAVCQEPGGCTQVPGNDGAPCDDADACTDEDRCEDGCVHGTPINCDDGNACTADNCDPSVGCVNNPIDCDDEDACTEDGCDPDTGCTHQAIECSKGQVCDPASGECIPEEDPCECVDGRVTICHVPPGNLANARTIEIGCRALQRHLAHGDSCGPCE